MTLFESIVHIQRARAPLAIVDLFTLRAVSVMGRLRSQHLIRQRRHRMSAYVLRPAQLDIEACALIVARDGTLATRPSDSRP